MLGAEHFDRIVGFIRDIGLALELDAFGPDGFLPGVTIRNGVLRVDPAHLYVSGDLLHEAGHIATVPARFRSQLGDNLETTLRDAIGDDPDPLAQLSLTQTENMAIAWSYAALKVLDLPAETIFFAGGYRMDTASQQRHFLHLLETGNNMGIGHLCRMGMTGPTGIMALLMQSHLPPYPAMTHWVMA